MNVLDCVPPANELTVMWLISADLLLNCIRQLIDGFYSVKWCDLPRHRQWRLANLVEVLLGYSKLVPRVMVSL